EDAPPPHRDEKGEIEGNYGGLGTPVSLTFLGPLFGEARMLALARAYREATGFHLRTRSSAPRSLRPSRRSIRRWLARWLGAGRRATGFPSPCKACRFRAPASSRRADRC